VYGVYTLGVFFFPPFFTPPPRDVLILSPVFLEPGKFLFFSRPFGLSHLSPVRSPVHRPRRRRRLRRLIFLLLLLLLRLLSQHLFPPPQHPLPIYVHTYARRCHRGVACFVYYHTHTLLCGLRRFAFARFRRFRTRKKISSASPARRGR